MKARSPTPRALLALALISLLWGPTRARAQAWLQSFQADRFTPAPALNDGLALDLPSTLPNLTPSVQLLGDYGATPLRSRAYGADGGDVDIISSRLNLHVVAALGLGSRAQVSVHAPITVYQAGEDPVAGGRQFAAVKSAGMSDMGLGGSLRLWGQPDRGPQLGLNAALSLPTGSEGSLGTDGGVGARGTLSVAQAWSAATLAFESGLSYRPERQYGFSEIGSEFLYRVGLYVPAGLRCKFMFELNGATNLAHGQLFEKNARPLEGLGGLRVRMGKGFYGNLGGGVGLLGGPGLPTARGLLGVGYMPSQEAKRERGASTSTPQPVDAATALDTDGDGIRDDQDLCVNEPEDLDHFQDSDGCPDPDNDLDGIPDDQDTCPRAAEDRDGVDDEDGCPEADGDRVPATVVAPATDETSAQSDGATPAHVHFDQNAAEVRGATRRDLRAALKWFGHHPGSYTLHLVGHASAEGSAEYNDQLSLARAQAAARYLQKHDVWLRQRGVKLTILTDGKGSREPIADNETPEGRAKNRRVEFRLKQR